MGFFPASYLAGLAVLLSVQHGVSYYNREAGLLFDAYPKQKLSLPNGVDGVKPNKSVSVKDKMDCVFACINVPWCRSVNFQTTPLNSGLYFCQLLSSEQFAHKKYMKKNRLYLHYSVKNPCQENPCRNGGKCILQDNRQEYQCNCAKGFKGDQCEIGRQP
ncbi:Basement membrane-specific heparan sulfate proteoglycan core protein [Exaiptasia diaphana]|nr:Basement membrane-specific heparan sulfate proteoglycan core protein [Exaiptasia diaphana]